MKDSTKALLWMCLLFFMACFSALLTVTHYANGDWWMMALMAVCCGVNIWTMILWGSLYTEYKHDEQQDHPL